MISKSAIIGKNVTIKEGVIIEDNVQIGDNCYIDYNTIIRANVQLGDDSFVGAQCILGELLYDFFAEKQNTCHPLHIGASSLIRSGSIIYGDVNIGSHFASGHRITIRESTNIGEHVNIGTLSDIQDHCDIGNYVHLHSNVFMGQNVTLKDYVWVFPCVTFTNDPMPPSAHLSGASVDEYACICAGAILLPGVHIGTDALVGAGSNVTKDVEREMVVVGNPAKAIKSVHDIKESDGTPHYPWRNRFDRGMPWQNIGYEEWQLQQAALK